MSELAEARAALAAAIERAPIPCANPSIIALWFDRAPTHRAAAANACLDCSALFECGRVAELADERFGVWGGVDREKPHRPTRKEPAWTPPANA